MNAPSLASSAASNGGAAALITILSWILAARGIALPPEVASGATVLIGALVHLLSGLVKLPTPGAPATQPTK